MARELFMGLTLATRPELARLRSLLDGLRRYAAERYAPSLDLVEIEAILDATRGDFAAGPDCIRKSVAGRRWYGIQQIRKSNRRGMVLHAARAARTMRSLDASAVQVLEAGSRGREVETCAAEGVSRDDSRLAGAYARMIDGLLECGWRQREIDARRQRIEQRAAALRTGD